MKKIKYIITFCAIWIGLLIIGESKVFYLDSFSDTFQYTTMYQPFKVDEKTMKEDILKASNQNNIEFFTMERTPTDYNSLEYKIYGTPGSIEYIKKRLNIEERKYNSLLLGDVSFEFKSFATTVKTPLTTTYFMIGPKEKVHNFKISLINKYAGNHPQEGTNGISRLPVISIWILVASVIFLFTFYDIISQRKENLIRVTMGEKMSTIIWINIVTDIAIFIFLFTISYFTVQTISNPNFEIELSILLFIFILLVNSLLYLGLFKYNLKETFSNSRTSKVTLLFNYSLKVITIIVTTGVLSSNILIIHQSYKFYQQRDFFEEKQNFSYVNINYELMEDDKEISLDDSIQLEQERDMFYNHTFYRQFFHNANALQTTNSNIGPIMEVTMNKNMEVYLKTLLPSIKSMTLSKDEYYFIPERLKDSLYVQDNMMGSSFFSEKKEYSSEIVFYDENIALTAIHTYENSSSYLHNPVILFNNKSIQDEDFKLAKDLIAFPYNRIMYEINDQEFDQFIKDNNLENQQAVKTNVWKHYLEQWDVYKHLLYINSIFTVIILLLEMLIITSIIRLEYQVNSLEIAIKKTLGYSLLRRNQKLLIITISMTLLGVLFSLVSAFILGISEGPYLLWGSLVILILELIVMSFLLNKVDNENVPKILKGGNV